MDPYRNRKLTDKNMPGRWKRKNSASMPSTRFLMTMAGRRMNFSRFWLIRDRWEYENCRGQYRPYRPDLQ